MPNWKYIDEVYLYDGTFFGFLTIVFNLYPKKNVPVKIVPKKDYEYNLLDKTIFVETDEEKSVRVFNGIEHNISYDTLYIVYNAFLSGKKDKEISILKYIFSAFEIGSNINNMITIDYVMDTLKMKGNSLFEAHRLKGLVKFRFVGNNLYYAPVHPDNNVIEILGRHFIRRLPTQNFIIHDKNRNISFIYNTKDSSIVDVPSNFVLPEFSDEELLYQSLWKTFFNTIAIKERTNKKLQMQFMPKKYWEDLIEVN